MSGHQKLRYLGYLALILSKIAILQRLLTQFLYMKSHRDTYFAIQCLEKLYFPCEFGVLSVSNYDNYITLNLPLHGLPGNPKPMWKSIIASLSSLIASVICPSGLVLCQVMIICYSFHFCWTWGSLPLLSSSFQFLLTVASNL